MFLQQSLTLDQCSPISKSSLISLPKKTSAFTDELKLGIPMSIRRSSGNLFTTHQLQIGAVVDLKHMAASLLKQLKLDVLNDFSNSIKLLEKDSSSSEVVWVAHNGMAKLGIVDMGTCLEAFVAPFMNPIAGADFVYLYKRVQNTPSKLQLKDSEGIDLSEATRQQIEQYQRNVDELLLLLFNAVVEQSMVVVGEHQMCRKYLSTVFVQLDTATHTNLWSHPELETLVWYAQKKPHAISCAGNLLQSSNTHSSIEKQLRCLGFEFHPNGLYQAWLKTGEKTVIATLVSSHEEKRLRVAQQTGFGHGIAVAKKELPPWVSFEADAYNVAQLLQATPRELGAMAAVTGVGLILGQPQGRSAIYLSGSPNPLSEFSLYRMHFERS